MHEHVLGLHVLVDDPLPVQLRERARHADGEIEESLHRHRRPDEEIEGLPAEVLQDEGGHALVGLERDRPHDPWEIERHPQLILAAQPFQIPVSTALRVEDLEHDGPGIAGAERSEQGGAATPVKRLDGRVPAVAGSARLGSHHGHAHSAGAAASRLPVRGGRSAGVCRAARGASPTWRPRSAVSRPLAGAVVDRESRTAHGVQHGPRAFVLADDPPHTYRRVVTRQPGPPPPPRPRQRRGASPA